MKMTGDVLLAIAHPDDDALYAYELQSRMTDANWHILCMTHDCNDERGCELIEYQRHMGVKDENIHFLGFTDERQDNRQNRKWYECSISISAVYERLKSLTLRPSYVISHNRVGEYGHPHHILLNRVITEHFKYDVVHMEFGYGSVLDDIQYSTSKEKIQAIKDFYPSQDYVMGDLLTEIEGFRFA